MTLYWAVYDISKGTNRTAVINVLKNYGFVRVQKSVFLGNVSRNAAETIAVETAPFLSPEADAFFLFPACTACFKARIIHGKLDDERVKERDYFFVS